MGRELGGFQNRQCHGERMESQLGQNMQEDLLSSEDRGAAPGLTGVMWGGGG